MDALATRSEELLDDEFDERLHLEFDLARLELVEARAAQEQKDTPAARLRVAECRSRVDSVLDRWNDVVLTAR
jgi:hypothetical protein